ncbi:alpha/beta fold hydrolase [Franconibacter helveticus]|uniref:alpha/beta hydrolase n=1 Tax=Franconibacter helveticus TaxID=357240 RepID=UPI002912DA77|nr:alpha/beta fold hydrolase [Franconibacter helveticus]MDU6924246.1 alpha/beta fold hydrolase [Franconibacter helveticus]
MRAVIVAFIALVILTGCQQRSGPQAPLGQDSFRRYQQETRDWVAARRAFQTLDKNQELAWNTPQEWRPAAARPEKGILLIHGLGDSPGSFSDIGPALARKGFLVRTLLLPGHGTRPGDLLYVSVDAWRRVVREQAAILARDAGKLYIGGFSTGGNLALEYAMTHPDVQGVALFSPAIKSSTRYDFLAPFAALFRDWLRPPGKVFPQQIATRYLRVPTNGFAQFYHTSAAVQRLLNEQTWNRPVVMVLAEHDSVLDTGWIVDNFDKRFTHPASRVIWYGSPRREVAGVSRVLVKPDFMPEARISQFSHMSVLFAPDNPYYGREGKEIICANGQEESEAQRCLKGETVWYSDWGYREEGKVHARLTWNPWFFWQEGVVSEVLNAG